MQLQSADDRIRPKRERKRSCLLAATALLVAATPVASVSAQATSPASDDWTTWGYDQHRSGWNQAEKTLSPANVGKLQLQWSAQLSTAPTDVALSTLTAPIVVKGVAMARGTADLVLTLGADNTLFAIDAGTGRIAWQKTFATTIAAKRAGTWLCPNTPNDTPVVDKVRGIAFFITGDGKLHAVALADGTEHMTPAQMVAPQARAWSLNLIDDVVYTTSGRACGEVLDPNSPMAAALSPEAKARAATAGGSDVPIDPSAVSAMDVRDLAHPILTSFFTSGGRPAAPWGRGGTALGPDGSVILETSDGLADPASGNFGDTILRLAPKVARAVDSFTPENHKFLFLHDLGGSASPLVFPYQDKTLVAVSQKEGVLYLLDANDLGGGPPENHQTPLYKAPQLGNDLAQGTDPSQGVWGAMSTYLTPDGKRLIFVPMWGPPSKDEPPFAHDNGPIPDGSIMAFQVTGTGDKPAITPIWTSPDMIMPDPPVVANGVVYAVSTGGQARQNPRMPDGSRYDPHTTGAHYRATPVSNLTLLAMDAETGKLLYSSKDAVKNWTHFSEPVVALGKVFVVTHDAHVYAFGLGK